MRRFRPGLAPTLVVFALLPLLIWLGFWQLSRSEQKRVLLEQYAERRLAPPIASEQLLALSDPGFRRVYLHGQFDARHSYLLDNRSRDGQVGVELLQPFLDTASGLWLLVNRGWLPWSVRRIPPVFKTPEQPVSLEAWVYIAPGATFQLRADPPTGSWPRLVTTVDPGKFWAELGRQGFAYELREERGPGVFQTGWPVVSLGMGPEKHLGYAVQWFALAVALCGLYLYLGRHNAREQRDGKYPESIPPE